MRNTENYYFNQLCLGTRIKTLGRTFHIVNRFGIYIFWPLNFSFDNKILYYLLCHLCYCPNKMVSSFRGDQCHTCIPIRSYSAGHRIYCLIQLEFLEAKFHKPHATLPSIWLSGVRKDNKSKVN